MIREARPADRAAVRAIQAAALAEPWPEMLELGVDGPPLLLVADRAVPQRGQRGTTTAPTDPDATDVVGYALAVTADEAAYLVEIAVAPTEQNQGVGSSLLRAVIQRLSADGVGELRLTVQAADDAARRFYERHGFTVHERVPDHYERGDGLLLVRSLDGE